MNMHWIDEIRKDVSEISSSPRELRKFGVLVGGIFLLISGITFWRNSWTPAVIFTFGACGLLLLIAGIILPNILKVIYRYWMVFAIILGSIVSRIVLFVLFYFILTLIAWMAKIFNKRFSIPYKEKERSTYWIDRDNKSINYERMS